MSATRSLPPKHRRKNVSNWFPPHNGHSSASSSPIAASIPLPTSSYKGVSYPRPDYYYAYSDQSSDACGWNHPYPPFPPLRTHHSYTKDLSPALPSATGSSFTWSSPSEDSEYGAGPHRATSDLDLDHSGYEDDMDLDFDEEDSDPDFFAHRRRISFSTSAERDQPFIRPTPALLSSKASSSQSSVRSSTTASAKHVVNARRRSDSPAGSSKERSQSLSMERQASSDLYLPPSSRLQPESDDTIMDSPLPPSSPPLPSSPLSDAFTFPSDSGLGTSPSKERDLGSDSIWEEGRRSPRERSPSLRSSPSPVTSVVRRKRISVESLLIEEPVREQRELEAILDEVSSIGRNNDAELRAVEIQTSMDQDVTETECTTESASPSPVSDTNQAVVVDYVDENIASAAAGSSTLKSEHLILEQAHVSRASSVSAVEHLSTPLVERPSLQPTRPLTSPLEQSSSNEYASVSYSTEDSPRSPAESSLTTPLPNGSTRLERDSTPPHALHLSELSTTLPLTTTPSLVGSVCERLPSPLPASRLFTPPPTEPEGPVKFPLMTSSVDCVVVPHLQTPISRTPSLHNSELMSSPLSPPPDFSDSDKEADEDEDVHVTMKKRKRSAGWNADPPEAAKGKGVKRRRKVVVSREFVESSDDDNDDGNRKSDHLVESKDEKKTVPMTKTKGVKRKRKIYASSSSSSGSDSEGDAPKSPSKLSSPTKSKPLVPPPESHLLNLATAVLPIPLPEFVGLLIQTLALTRATSMTCTAIYKGLSTGGGVCGKGKAVARKSQLTLLGPSKEQKKKGRGRKSKKTLEEEEKMHEKENVAGDVDAVEEDVDVELGKAEWVRIIEVVLEEEGARWGLFGKVESSFKDSPSSHSALEAQWFYVPERDPDGERAEVIKSMMPRAGKRNETKKYKQYYWRPLGKVSRWDSEGEI
ncbi:hypothetical protein ABKN59_011685 [Abortiporus biennis]